MNGTWEPYVKQNKPNSQSQGSYVVSYIRKLERKKSWGKDKVVGGGAIRSHENRRETSRAKDDDYSDRWEKKKKAVWENKIDQMMLCTGMNISQ